MSNRGEAPSSPVGPEAEAHLTGHAAQAALDLAVSGPRPDLLATMSASAGWRADDLDPLLQARLIVLDEDRVITFVNDDARDLILAAAPPATVREAHRRAAIACRDLHLPVRTVVEHLVSSTLLADDDVARELERMAERAQAEDDLRAASDAWQAAARLSTQPAHRVDRALRGLRLVIASGLDYAGVDVLLDLLAGEQLSSECASWVEWFRALQRSEVDPDAAVTAQWSTIRRARDASPGTLRALLWDAAMNAWTLGDAPAGLRAAREYAAVESAMPSEESGVEPPWAGTGLLAAALFEIGEVAESTALRCEAITAAAKVEPTTIAFDNLLSIAFLDDLLVDMSTEASERIQVAMQRAPGESATMSCLLGISAWRARTRSEWKSCDDLLTRGRPMAAATGATGAQLGMAALSVELAAIRGADATLREESAWLREHATRKGDRRRLATVERALGLEALAAGRLDEAIVRLTAAADAPFLGRRLRDGVIPARVDLVEALSRQGDRVAATERAETLRPLLAGMGDALASALECRVAALVAEGETVLALFDEALAHHARAQDAFERARTLLLFGEEERRHRHRGAARKHLIEAVDTFEVLGARPWYDRARNELRAVGGRVDVPVGPNPLTTQELAVARQAANGLTTREIADTLFLSPRTVEFHLSNAYRKLGIHGRSGLAARLGSLDSFASAE